MKNLQLIKSEHFGDIQADIYSNGDDMFMTIAQLANCLEYAGKDALASLISRNPYIKQSEFSVTCKLQAPDGKLYETRIFTEDGIYEVTMLSGQPKAKEFRAWIRGILKALRKGSVKLVPMSAYQREQIEQRRERNRVMAQNSANTSAKIIDKALSEAGVSPKYKVIALQSIYEGVGIHLPIDGVEVATRYYDATAIAQRLGIMSLTGNPHAHAVSAIIEHIHPAKEECVRVPCVNPVNGHADSTMQYADSVIEKVRDWLKDRDNPTRIAKADGSKTYTVRYEKEI